MASIANNRIDTVFANLAKNREKALITYIMAGDPDLSVTRTLVKTLAECGADIIELGVPFSDPLADGPAIQRAGQRSLATGTNLAKILELTQSLRAETQVPIVLMTYYNPLLKFGLERFAAEAAACQVDGVIVPDLPLEESDQLADLLNAAQVHLVPLLAPTSTDSKIERVAQRPAGFVYCVSLTGVTGARDTLPTGVEAFLGRVKSRVNQPFAVGFGISNPEQAKKMAQFANGVIVGSAIVNLVEKYRTATDRLADEVKSFVGALKRNLQD